MFTNGFTNMTERTNGMAGNNLAERINIKPSWQEKGPMARFEHT
jgi:hypothetical protein